MTFVQALAELQSGPNVSLLEGRDHGDFDFSFFIVSAPPGGGPVLHKHPYAEAFVVQEGEATFTAGDDELRVEGGHVVVVPPETPHRFENTGDGPLRMVTIHPNGKVVQTDLE